MWNENGKLEKSEKSNGLKQIVSHFSQNSLNSNSSKNKNNFTKFDKKINKVNNLQSIRDSPGISNYISHISNNSQSNLSIPDFKEDSLNESDTSMNVDEQITQIENKGLLDNLYKTQSKSNFLKTFSSEGNKSSKVSVKSLNSLQKPKNFQITFKGYNTEQNNYLNDFSDISSIICEGRNFTLDQKETVNKISAQSTSRFIGTNVESVNCFNIPASNLKTSKASSRNHKHTRSISSSNGQLISHQSVFEKSSQMYISTANDLCEKCKIMRYELINSRKEKMDIKLDFMKIKKENDFYKNENSKIQKLLKEKERNQDRDREYLLKQEKEIQRLTKIIEKYNTNLHNLYLNAKIDKLNTTSKDNTKILTHGRFETKPKITNESETHLNTKNKDVSTGSIPNAYRTKHSPILEKAVNVLSEKILTNSGSNSKKNINGLIHEDQIKEFFKI